MSLLRRRMMMQTAKSEPIPRERLVFSHAGDVLMTGVTKKNDGDAICGLAIISQSTYSPGTTPYWAYLILITKSGVDWNAYKANSWVNNDQAKQFTFRDKVKRIISTTNSSVPKFATVADGVAYLNTINPNKLPIMNTITGKTYSGTWEAYATFHSTEAAQDLLDYYNGVI